MDTIRPVLAATLMLGGLVTASALQPSEGPAPSAAAADLVLTGGRIATLAHGAGFVEALAVKDGLVHATGSDADVLRDVGPETRVLDLDGRAVVPGLNDSHLHATRGGRFFNLELRWDGVGSLARGLDMVAAQARRTPPDQWVRVIGGWSPFQFAEQRMPTIAELNEAAPETPVFVLFLYSKGFLNTAGVRALGLDESTEPPPGSRYRFVDGGAELLAEPNPTILYKTIGALPQMSADDQLNSTRHFYRDLNRFGITSAIDAGGGGHGFPADYTASESLAAAGELPLRLSYHLFPQRPGHELEDFRRWTEGYSAGSNGDRLRSGGYVLEGGGEFLVWSAGDFENFLAPQPELKVHAEEDLAAVVEHLVRERWPFRIHATYGESIDRLLDVFAEVDPRRVIDHAETIRPDQIQRIQRMGGGIAIQDRMAFAGEFFAERYGAEAAAFAPPLRELVDSGVPLGVGSDATRVSSYNPWVTLSWLVTGRTAGGTRLYPPSNRLTRLEALRLHTLGSAWISGEELAKGRLVPGQYADLTVLSDDYFEVPGEAIDDIESVLTIVGGDIVYGAAEFADLDSSLPAVSPAWSPVAVFGGYAGAALGDDR